MSHPTGARSQNPSREGSGRTRDDARARVPALALAGLASALLGLLLMAERLGPISRPLSLAAGWLLLGAAIGCAAGNSWAGTRAAWGWRAVGCLALLGAPLLPPAWRPASAGLAFFAASRAVSGRSERAMLEILAAQAAMLMVMLPWFDAAPALLRLEQTWAEAISGAARAISGRSVSAGPGMLGFDAGLAGLALAVALALRGGVARASLLLRFAATHFVPLGWAIALTRLPGMDAPIQFMPVPEAPVVDTLTSLVGDTPVAWSALAVSCALAAAIPLLFRTPLRLALAHEPDRPHGSWLAAAVAVASIGCAGTIPAWHQKPEVARDRAVALYEHGYVNWLRPDSTRYGRMSGGMLGLLPDYLSAIGLRPKRISEITLASLGDAKVLVFVNLEHLLSPEEQRLVWTWVRSGGHLLVFGEHTWNRAAGNPANVLLEPSQIRLRHDSANFFTAGWINGYRFPLDPLTVGLSPDGNDPGVVVGASLECGPASRPLIVGRIGYSDAPALGDSTGGYVGDLRYSPGEPLGDLVLSATQPFERGRVTVFGDTSPLFNGIAASTFGFTSRLFLWAAASPAEPRTDAWMVYAVVLGLVGLALLAGHRRQAGALAIAALVAAAGGWSGVRRMSDWPQPFVSGRIALVDSSFMPSSYVGGWEQDDTFGLSLACMRSGYLTLHSTRLDGGLLEQASLLAMVAPRRALSARDANRLVSWIEGGGTLLLATGAEEQSQARALLERLGVSIRPRPLGKILARDGPHEVPMPESWPLALTPDAATRSDSVLTFEGELIGVRLGIGRGRAIVIGDAQCFRNFNLEHDEHEHVPNIAFLARLLDRADRAEGDRP